VRPIERHGAFEAVAKGHRRRPADGLLDPRDVGDEIARFNLFREQRPLDPFDAAAPGMAMIDCAISMNAVPTPVPTL
jgi:hypothetical protein